MAERVTDEVAKRLNNQSKCTTDQRKLVTSGFENYQEVEMEIERLETKYHAFSGTPKQIEYVVHNYGSYADAVLAQAKELLSAYPPEFALLLAELRYTVKNEMVCSLLDFYDRRTGRINFNIDSVRRTMEVVGSALANLLNWDQQKLQQERAELEEMLLQRSTFN